MEATWGSAFFVSRAYLFVRLARKVIDGRTEVQCQPLGKEGSLPSMAHVLVAAGCSCSGDRRRPRHASGWLVALVATLAIACCFAVPLQAQTAPSAGTGKKGRHAAATCTLEPRPNTLWSLAQCCAKDLSGNSTCVLYDAKDEYVIVKDNAPEKPDAYLIIPTVPVTGIEDPKIFGLPFLDFWQDGWLRSQKYPGRPGSETALAINSKYGRSQNQLHIHISCVLPDVSKTLQSTDVPAYPAPPVKLHLGTHGNIYAAVKVTGLTGQNSPFNVVESFPGVKGHMAEQSIAVIGSLNPSEYYVVDTYRNGSNPGHAEELLDQTCRLANGGN